jgi:uncharacterized protein YcfL
MKKSVSKFNTIIAIVITILLVAVFSFYFASQNSYKKASPSIIDDSAASAYDDQTIDGILISGFNMSYQDSQTSASAIIKNTTSEVVYINYINATLKDGNGNDIITLMLYVDKKLEPNEEVTVESSANIDVTNAKVITYIIVK